MWGRQGWILVGPEGEGEEERGGRAGEEEREPENDQR